MPTPCPQLQITTVNCRGAFSQVEPDSSLWPRSCLEPRFFSGSGSSYIIGKAINTTDEDWDFQSPGPADELQSGPSGRQAIGGSAETRCGHAVHSTDR
jgi:hypothetical protein